MGNCFGKPKSDNFSSQGQTLGSNPPPKPVTSTPAPKSAVAATYSPTPKGGRTLGASPSPGTSDPRTAAAMAAENRNQPKPARGKLGKQLDAQRAQTQNETRNEASREALLARNADANAEARRYN
ncbi:hypothetical protein M436DRAFT_63311 [Aureobasidium namibiae CBS 147.97]|uniref:Uncharacterized protein n=1 Tax=Aureobasidium namibiae CBS 147.97 TaxID=1043004 RepID=A0A074WQT4_9PEZI